MNRFTFTSHLGASGAHQVNRISHRRPGGYLLGAGDIASYGALVLGGDLVLEDLVLRGSFLGGIMVGESWPGGSCPEDLAQRFFICISIIYILHIADHAD